MSLPAKEAEAACGGRSPGRGGESPHLPPAGCTKGPAPIIPRPRRSRASVHRPSVCLSIRPPIHLSIHPPVGLSVHLSIHLPICLSVHLPIYPDIRPSAHLSVHPSVRPPIQPSVRPSICPALHPPPALPPSAAPWTLLPRPGCHVTGRHRVGDAAERRCGVSGAPRSCGCRFGPPSLTRF